MSADAPAERIRYAVIVADLALLLDAKNLGQGDAGGRGQPAF
jgi:hypothetical protein